MDLHKCTYCGARSALTAQGACANCKRTPDGRQTDRASITDRKTHTPLASDSRHGDAIAFVEGWAVLLALMGLSVCLWSIAPLSELDPALDSLARPYNGWWGGVMVVAAIGIFAGGAWARKLGAVVSGATLVVFGFLATITWLAVHERCERNVWVESMQLQRMRMRSVFGGGYAGDLTPLEINLWPAIGHSLMTVAAASVCWGVTRRLARERFVESVTFRAPLSVAILAGVVYGIAPWMIGVTAIMVARGLTAAPSMAAWCVTLVTFPLSCIATSAILKRKRWAASALAVSWIAALPASFNLSVAWWTTMSSTIGELGALGVVLLFASFQCWMMWSFLAGKVAAWLRDGGE